MSRYSQLYIDRGRRVDDSPRARRRLCSRCLEVSSNFLYSIQRSLQNELGYHFSGRDYYHSLGRFFTEAETRDLLDAITIVAALIGKNLGSPSAKQWIDFVGRVFHEENLSYRIDNSGVVHPFVDTEFQVNQNAALEALNEARFGEASDDFKAAFRHLRNGDGKAAIRMMFPAVETAAKVLFPGKFARLSENEVDRYIRPALEQRYAGNQPAIDAGRSAARRDESMGYSGTPIPPRRGGTGSR